MLALLFVTMICHFSIVLQVLQVRIIINPKSLGMPNQHVGCDNCTRS